MCQWARGQQSCRPRREDGGNIGLQRQGRGYQRRTRPGVAFGFVCDGVGAGRAALSKHRLSTRHLFGALKCREGSPGLCFLPMTDLAGHPLGISRGCWLFTSPLCLAHLPQMAGT